MGQRYKPYRLIGAYDSETTNYNEGLMHRAFPVLHQLGLLNAPIEDVNADNVEQVCSIHLFRHTFELCAALDAIAGNEHDFVPVIACHNLSFDMYPLASWLMSHEVRVLAKSRRKPITFTILDEKGSPRLVIWDTLVFSQQPLDAMGRDCGYLKASGSWDYDLIRTPETPLTDDESEYAKRDVYALLAWLGWWLSRNPDIEPERLGLNVVTKTGVVRERRRKRFDQVKGKGQRFNIGRFWLYMNREQMPKTDDELFSMHACTRGGFTFCASRSACVPFDLSGTDLRIAAYDAVSMHPAQMVSHKYPVGFHEASPDDLRNAFEIVMLKTVGDVLRKFQKPFPVAFNALFEFENIRPKAGSIFEREGVLPLASARFRKVERVLREDNEQAQLFEDAFTDAGYKDEADDPSFAFGKLVSAKRARIWLTELAAFEVCRCYDFDSVRAVKGYMTLRFVRPTDMSVVSVMQFYKAKNVFKAARAEYKRNGRVSDASNLRACNVSEAVCSAMEAGTISDADVDITYLGLKADLNSLFGIEATTEHRQDTILTPNGIDYAGGFGVCNSPRNPKAWYQFGQRIVGWSRIAQLVTMEIAAPYVARIVNGDTDSVKFLVNVGDVPALEGALSVYARAVDKAKNIVCSRVRRAYPDLYDPLDGIGAYTREFMVDRFCAAWNKAYLIQDEGRDGKRHFDFTIAGIPAKSRGGRIGLNEYADMLYASGAPFPWLCSLILGYNVMIHHSMTGLNARSFPEWGSAFCERVTDHRGITSLVAEPCALSLYPMDKEVSSLSNPDNYDNSIYGTRNNPDVNTDNVLLFIDKHGRARHEIL